MPQTQTISVLTADGADALAATAEALARAKGLALCIAVTDEAGHLQIFRRMQGAARISIDVAIGKSRTAALFAKETAGFAQMIDSGSPSMLSVPGATLIGGGVPIVHDGQCLGALGISGATSDTDTSIARAAVAQFLENL